MLFIDKESDHFRYTMLSDRSPFTNNAIAQMLKESSQQMEAIAF
ncbi:MULTISPECIES: hypothetical protein [Cyanophyceae]|nr:hypothetical protein [Trichocoleus sp. FACHB-40]